jgi:hypothetical protein
MGGLEWGLVVFIGIGLALAAVTIAAVLSSDEED